MPGGGWEALQGFFGGDLEEDPIIEQLTFWESGDGLRWQPLGARPSSLGAPDAWYYDYDHPRVAVDVNGRHVAVVHDESANDLQGCTSLHVSMDGTRFVQIVEVIDCADSVAAATAPGPDGRWFVLGYHPDPDPDVYKGEAYLLSSLDLASWSRVSVPSAPNLDRVMLRSLTRGSVGYVLVGDATVAGYVSANVTWLSDDAVTWRVADVGSLRGWTPWLAEGPAGMLAVTDIGSYESSAVNVWKLEVPEAQFGG
jgi:hypothetical protein